MGEFNIDQGIEYFNRMYESIKQTYITKYGFSEEKADEVAFRTAAYLLVRNVGPVNADEVLKRVKRK